MPVIYLTYYYILRLFDVQADSVKSRKSVLEYSQIAESYVEDGENGNDDREMSMAMHTLKKRLQKSGRYLNR